MKSLKEEVLDYLLIQIDTGEIKVGDQVPGQHELARRLGVSYGPASQALMDLKRMGLTVSRGRLGTFLKCTLEEVKVSEKARLLEEYRSLEAEVSKVQLRMKKIFEQLVHISDESD